MSKRKNGTAYRYLQGLTSADCFNKPTLHNVSDCLDGLQERKQDLFQLSFCFLVQLLGKFLVFPLFKEKKTRLAGMYVPKRI